MEFHMVRDAALVALLAGEGTDADDVLWLPCVWQQTVPDDGHVAIYCNLRSHLTALYEFLGNATWCDELVISAMPRDDEQHEQLFRYFGMAFLILDQIVEDLRDVWNVLGRGVRRSGDLLVDDLATAVNHIWKHRRDALGDRVMHIHHNHGPYLFVDVLASRRDVPASSAIGLAVPSLIAAVAAHLGSGSLHQ